MVITYADIVESVKRVVKWSTISGSFTEVDLLYYIEDAYARVQVDYPSITSYTFSIGATPAASTITPAPDIVDKVLLSTRAGFNVLHAYGVELIGDAVMIRAGSISLDTSKALRSHGVHLDRLAKDYDDLIDNLNINGKTSDTDSAGTRVDNYISTYSQIGNKDSESLI